MGYRSVSVVVLGIWRGVRWVRTAVTVAGAALIVAPLTYSSMTHSAQPSTSVAPLSVSVSRNHLVDSSGQVLTLRGVDLSGTASTPPAEATTELSASGGAPHIMVLMMENEDYSDVSSLPYESSLISQYQTYTNYYGLGHYSLDNYVGLVSGNWYAASDTDPDPSSWSAPASDTTVANQMEKAGISWASYQGEMTQYCEVTDDGTYAVRHDPWAYFPSVTDCASHVFPESQMISDLKKASPPDFVELSPSLAEDGGNDGGYCDASCGDAYLSTMIPAIEKTGWYNSGGSIVLTYDEGSNPHNLVGEDHSQGGDNGVLTVVISAATQGLPRVGSYVNHWGLLAGIEQAYGLSCLGQA